MLNLFPRGQNWKQQRVKKIPHVLTIDRSFDFAHVHRAADYAKIYNNPIV